MVVCHLTSHWVSLLTSIAVVKDEGPDFYVEVEKVPVPEVGMSATLLPPTVTSHRLSRSNRNSNPLQAP